MFLIRLVFSCLCFMAAFHIAQQAFAVKKTNFVFFLVDDLGRSDIGIEGSQFYETPHIDGLARSGMRFNNGYAACQVCSPSRASIMLGKAPPRHGITQYIGGKSGLKFNRGDPVMPVEYVRNLPAEDITIAEALKSHGYKTFFAGKWHLGSKGSWPEDHGFDINQGGWDVGTPRKGFFAPWENPRLPSGPDGESLTLRLGQETADFIKDHANKKPEQPFLAFLSFYAVHAPIQTTPALWKKYQQKADKMGLLQNKKRFIFDRRLPVRQVQDNPIYAGMMETLDTAVGKVLNQLKASGIEENTVVMFTGDNGGVTSGDAFATSSLPFRGGKGRQWEGGFREPYYIRAPGVTKPGSLTEAPAIGMDFYPTILELAGLPAMPMQHVDGKSLVPALKGEKTPDRDLYWHYPHYGNQGGEPSSIIRRGDWKLIFYHEDQRIELYNLSSDVGEQNDLAGSQPERVKNLKEGLDLWLKETGATFPEKDPRFTQKKFDAKIKAAKTKRLQGLEVRHANYLKPDYKPNANWWKSAPVKK